ncbi:MAG: hypothetical protein ACR2NZ_10455 [Rubripirellula sp.]
MRNVFLVFFAAALFSSTASAADFLLTIGGGYSPSGNQASLEKNVLFYQRLLSEQGMDSLPHDVYFSDGQAAGEDLQVIDRGSLPRANRLMAEFFGSEEDLGLSYRNHQVPGVSGGTRPENIRKWFQATGSKLREGDRLLIYVTAHGNRSNNRRNEHDTTIATWNNTAIKMTEFVSLLDQLPKGVEVIAVMVQCHAGGFARFIFNGGDPDRGLSAQRRIGFFATVHDRPAAGCTSDIDETSYVEYSTYFWAALGGRDRSGNLIAMPDYDENGFVSFDEAHAYVILTADTIDLPVKTSGEYLTVNSKFGDEKADLLTNDESYELILSLATPVQRAILEGLSEQLELSGDDRVVDAWKETQPRRGQSRGRSRGSRTDSQSGTLRRRIAVDLKRRWPGLANVLNPVAIELVTTRSEEFIEAIEDHPDYERYRELALEAKVTPNDQKRRVKFDRFLRTADNVIMAENLRRSNDKEKISEYEALMRLEQGTLKPAN